MGRRQRGWTRRTTFALAGVVLLLVVVSGCRWPRDAGTTLDDVTGGVLRVGVSEAPPWTRHVWAVPLGENGWQVEVERFLLALSHREVEDLLVDAEREEAAA